MKIKFEKRDLLWIAASVVLLSGIFAFAYGTSNPSYFGHSAGEVMVSVGGQEKTLQQAIDDGSIRRVQKGACRDVSNTQDGGGYCNNDEYVQSAWCVATGAQGTCDRLYIRCCKFG